MNEPSPVSTGSESMRATVTRAPSAIVMATDVPLYAEGLALVLAADGRLHLTGVVPTAALAGAVEAAGADAVLLDVAMPDACRAIRTIRTRLPQLAIILFGVPEADDELLDCIEGGATAFVSRDAPSQRLIETVIAAIHGDALMSARVTAVLLQRLAGQARHAPARDDTTELTERELEIATLLDEGLSNKEIAVRLNISVATVKNHVHHVLSKLGVQRRGQAASRLRSAMNPRI
ncbi:MAG: response regulator transcription factor [Gemmatimonadota bacterium]